MVSRKLYYFLEIFTDFAIFNEENQEQVLNDLTNIPQTNQGSSNQ